MLKVRPETLREIEHALDQYATEVERSQMTVLSKWRYIRAAGWFVRWLKDDFSPGETLVSGR